MILQVLILTILFIILGAGAAFLTAKRMTGQLEKLALGAKEMGNGRLEQEIKIDSQDEIGELSASFNRMAQKLKESMEELEKSNIQLAQANVELMELDRMKSEFLANVSHELRTPLTSIRGYTDYILEQRLGPVTEKQTRGLSVIQRNISRLTKLIDALLDFTKMESHKMVLEIKSFGLKELFEEIIQTVHSQLEEQKLTATVKIPEGLPLVLADRERISQALENLVINAIKFTPPKGKVELLRGA
ncbi:MAG: histidine kinase dimerization/phospho-acceptor domain-containing protein [Candidatus Edwardsbacteria bacterium]